MALPFFYIDQFQAGQSSIELDEDNSRHAIQVLRMEEGEGMHLTDGKGHLITASIVSAHKKHCTVKVDHVSYSEPVVPAISMGVSLLKNNSRFEWFLEKATEIGINQIIPLLCTRTERTNFRWDRMNAILISALLQSQQVWLPVLEEPVEVTKLIHKTGEGSFRLMAHCMEGEKTPIFRVNLSNVKKLQLLIGPEGDFTPQEWEIANEHNYHAVSLGETRLRTETAAVVAATHLRIR